LELNDLLKLFSLFNIVVLGHIIYPPFYTENVTLYSQRHENLFSVARQQVDNLLTYLVSTLLIKKENREVKFEQLFRSYFVQQVRCLIRSHKTKGEEETGELKVKRVVEAMATSFYRMDWFADELKLQKKLNRPDTTFDWISKEKFDISLRETLLTSTLSFLYD
jgi:hypothetical protein